MTRLTAFFLLMLLTAAGCLPQAKKQSCTGGTVFNSNSRECVPITSGGTTNGVSITAKSPAVSTLTVAQGQTATTSFTVTINDTLNQGYLIRWLLYPPSGVTFTGNPLIINTSTYDLIPNSLGLTAGLWTLAAEVMDSNGSALLTSTQWALTVTSNPTPTLSISSPVSTTLSRLTTDLTTQNFVVNVVDTSATPTSWRLRWYFDGVARNSVPNYTAGSNDVTGLTETFFSSSATFSNDNPPLTAGPHLIRAELLNSTGTSVFDFKEWTVFVYAPNLPQVSTVAPPLPDNALTVSGIDGVALNSTGFRVNSSDIFPSEDFCVAVNDFDGTRNNGVPGGVIVQFKNNGIAVGAPQTFIGNHTYVCLGDFAPTFNMTLANASVGEFKTVSATVTDVDTGTAVATINWGVSLRPKNTAPIANISSPVPTTLVIPVPLPFNPGGNYVVQLQDVAQTYTIVASDEDTTTADLMDVAFFVDGVAMNGVNNFPGTSVTTPDCTHAAAVAPFGATRLQCAVTLPSYDLAGRRDPRSNIFTITARVTDQASNGGGAQTSNVVSWSTITVNPNAPAITDTASTIAAQGASIVTNSYIAALAAPSTPIIAPVSVPEGSDVVFSVLVSDTQRDDFYFKIVQCLDGAPCLTQRDVSTQFLVTRSDDTIGKRVTFSHTIPEDTVTGGASATVTYQVSVFDQLPNYDSNALTLDQGIVVTRQLSLLVTNSNPFPLWGGSATPALASTLNVIAGMPLTLDPGSITDASLADGSTILYQWEASTDGGTTWNSITGATARVLKWTPTNDIAGASVQLRLCLGDDGTGNGLALCTGIAAGAQSAPALPATQRFAGPWTGVVAKSNQVAKSAVTPTANGEVASWYDATEREMYLVYINKAGVDASSLIVEKYDVATNGTMTLNKVQSFATERSGAAYDASNLSVVGQRVTIGANTYRGLYISYVTKSAPTVAPRIRVRRVELTNDEMIFTYSGFYEASCHGTTGYTANCGTANVLVTEGVSSGTVTLQVVNSTFDASDYIAFNGVILTPLAAFTASPGDCEFLTVDASNVPLTTDVVMANIETSYYNCTGSTGDPRLFAPSSSPVGDQWAITNFPQDWVDMSASLLLGKAGDIMLQSDTVLIPYLDNLNSGRLAVAVVGTVNGGFASGSLARTASPYNQVPSYVTPAGTVSAQDLSNSYGDAGSFDVAMVTSVSGLNAYRLSFNPPATIGVTSSVLNVFGAGEVIEKPRIATGASATNNHVFILAQDAASVTGDLVFARISAATYALAPTMPVIPLDAVHEQGKELTDYRIQALSGNKRAVLTVVTDNGASNGDVLMSVIRPVTATSDVPMLKPAAGGAGTAYPKIEDNISTANVPYVGLSRPFTFQVGDAGATAAENSKESILLVHPSAVASGLAASFLNVTEESISATAVDGAGAFQPPYIK